MPKIQVRNGKRGKTYRIEFMRGGRRISKTFKTKKEASLFSSQLVADDNYADSLTNRTLNSLKFSDAASEYLKVDDGKDPSKRQRLNHWVGVFQQKPVGKITSRMIKDELKSLSKTKAPATTNRYKSAIASLYKFLSDEYDIQYNPTREISQAREDNARTRFLSDGELDSLLSACKASKWDRLYLLVLMAVTTGARRSELITLDWSDIDLNSRTAHLKATKNGDQRILTLPTGVVVELMKYRQAKGWLFPYPNSDIHYFRNFDCYWRKALSDAGISGFRFHDLRHSCASILAKNGATLLEIGEVLGHRNITMTQRYAHLCVGHKQAMTDRIFGGIGDRIAL